MTEGLLKKMRRDFYPLQPKFDFQGALHEPPIAHTSIPTMME